MRLSAINSLYTNFFFFLTEKPKEKETPKTKKEKAGVIAKPTKYKKISPATVTLGKKEFTSSKKPGHEKRNDWRHEHQSRSRLVFFGGCF